jgi:flagellar basal body-associated protein FliL
MACRIERKTINIIMNTFIILAVVGLAAVVMIYSLLKSEKKAVQKTTAVKADQVTPVEPAPVEDPLDRQGSEPTKRG